MKKMLAALLAGLIGMGAAVGVAASLDPPGEPKEGAPSPESQALLHSHKVLGKVVRGSDDEELGRITQILLDPESGQAVYVAITSEKGVPGGAQEERLVPWQALQVHPETFAVRLAMTESQFEQGPRWAVISSERQAEEINRFYGVAPRWQHEGAAAGQQQQERGDLKTDGSRMPQQGRPQPPRRQP